MERQFKTLGSLRRTKILEFQSVCPSCAEEEIEKIVTMKYQHTQPGEGLVPDFDEYTCPRGHTLSFGQSEEYNR